MLYNRHFGYKGDFEKGLRERDPKALELFDQVEELKREAAEFMKVRAVWQFFEAERDGNSIRVCGGPTFHFDRQSKEDGLCLSDYILDQDHLALFVVTAGEGIREKSEEWKKSGEFLKAHGIQALALETAEAGAEWLHRRIREDWGLPDDRGKRYSFGYPACPNLDAQQGLFELLDPAEIGVTLTDGMMMEPEASVSALVFHHPDCVYFSVKNDA